MKMDDVMENKKKFECDQSLEYFNRNFSLTLHKTVIHSSAKTLKCKQSGKIYNLENEFQSDSHDNQENFEKSTEDEEKSLKDMRLKRNQCLQCNKTFNSKQSLEKHVSTIHNKQ